MTSNAGGKAEMFSLVIPVYMNEGSLDRLLDELIELGSRVSGELEAVFVVDGSPDRPLEILRERLPAFPLATQLVSLSRSFGSFAAIAAGLKCARGEFWR
ncbi:MAG: glycosyltransferase [Bryobacteraceae bacterium]